MMTRMHAVKLVVTIVTGGLSMATVHAAPVDDIQIPDTGIEMIAESDPTPADNVSGGGENEFVSASRVSVKDLPFERAIRITVKRKPEVPWNVQLSLETEGAITKGDVALLSFYIRGPRNVMEAGDARVGAYVQLNEAPHTKLASLRANGKPEWQRLFVPFKASRTLPEGKSNVVFHIGYYPQTVDIGGVSLLNFRQTVALNDLPRNRVTYDGRDTNAQWRQEAIRRIERIRKADLTVHVRNARNEPVSDATITARMTRHAFGFGSAVTARMLSVDSDDGRRYRDVVARHFNKVVFENDLKWGPWEAGKSNTHSRYRREFVERSLDWLKARNISVRGHYVTWAPLKDRQLQTYEGKPDKLKRDLWSHMEEKLPAIGARVDEWDAVNHIVGWGTRIADITGDDTIYADIIRHARELAPDVDMWINEGSVLPNGSRRDAYARMARFLATQGAAPDGIGFMGHFGAASLTPPAEILAQFDRFATIVPRLQITEFDVGVGPDEDLHADYLRDVMIAAFSHPAVEAVVMWGFWEGRHWRHEAMAHLWTQDWQLRQAGRQWLDLVFSQWWTDVDARSDNTGTCTIRGFLGDYEITAVLPDGTRLRWTGPLPKTGTTVVLQTN